MQTKKTQLTFGDFEEHREDNASYFEYSGYGLPEGYTITLEPCFNGYDVALYDETLSLVGEKACTDVSNPEDGGNIIRRYQRLGLALSEALRLAQEKLDSINQN